jgi:hypothetical protein
MKNNIITSEDKKDEGSGMKGVKYVISAHCAKFLLMSGFIVALGVAVVSSADSVQAASQLSWAPPTLTDPITLYPTSSNKSFKLDNSKDYKIVLPNTPFNTGADREYMSVNGGHNVVMIGGELTANQNMNGVVRFTGQTGTIHIEGIRVTGSQLGEGFQFQNMPNAIVQFENVYFDPVTVNCSYEQHHCDLFQI